MARLQKRLLFSLCGFLSLCCALAAATSAALPLWLRGRALCRTGAHLVNASGAELHLFLGELRYGLFHGVRVKQCGLGGRPARFSCLHVSIVVFCGLVVVFSSVATGFFFFNAFGRPYETLQGPMGLYLWTFISCVCSGLVLVLFAAEVKLHGLTERIANFNERSFEFRTHSERFGRGFWLFLLVLLLHGLNALLTRLAGARLPLQPDKQPPLSGGAADLMY